MLRKWIAILMTVCLLGLTPVAMAEPAGDDTDWVSFLLMCDEGMQNDGANVGNTMMLVSVAPFIGKIRLMVFTWDTFVDYAGYDIPQLIDQPYRNNGPAETMRVFNDNFGTDIKLYMSLNYLNLANLIDNYGGVDVDISRAERNALNGMVGSKKKSVQDMADTGLLSQLVVEMLAQEYYLEDYGPDTHLNGLQAVGFGWLQYDSVYNCCLREVNVIGNLFHSVGKSVENDVLFYSDLSEKPEEIGSRRAINLSDMTDDDWAFVRREVNPIFELSYHNLTDEEIDRIALALVYAGYLSARQGQNIFDAMDYAIFPLEATEPYEYIAGVPGHVVDYAANGEAIREFLYGPIE